MPTPPPRSLRPSRASGAARSNRDARGNHQVEETLDLLYRRRWLILATFVLTGALAAAFALTRTPFYQTSALVLVDLERTEGAAGSLPSASEPGLFSPEQRSVQTELFVLNQSRGIRERVQARLKGPRGEMPPGVVSFALADRNVASGIQINAAGPDPQATAALANAYAEEYVAQTQVSGRGYLKDNREFLEEQAARLRGEVNAADATLEGRMTSAGPSSLGSSQLLSQLAALKSQRDEALIDRQMRSNQLASINAQLGDITPSLAGRVSEGTDRQLAALDGQIAAQQRLLQPFEARQARGEAIDEGVAQAVRARIAALQSQKATLSSRYVSEAMRAGGTAAPAEALSLVSTLRSQAAQERVAVSGLDGRISQLNARIGQISGDLSRSPSQTISVERATQDRETASQSYATVAAQLEQVRVQEASLPGYARILREAPVPWLPTGPGWIRTIGLGLLVGLGLGVALAIARDRIDPRVYKPEHVTALGLLVLETVPDLGPVIKDALGGARSLPVDGRDVVSELVTLHAPLSPASETYRHLRTAVQFSRPDVPIRTVVVTSAGAGDGKSTTASNLAVAFAQSGRRTALLDADFRRPRVHDVFGVPPHTGLYQLVQPGPSSSDGAPVEGPVGPPNAAVLRRTLEQWFRCGVDGLFVVPAGAVAVEDPDDAPDDGRATLSNPAEVLGSHALRSFIDTLLETVDVVVIDTPPVLVATDAVLLASQADATVLVTTAGVSKSGDIRQSLAHLDDVGAHVAGAVLNRFTLDKALGYAYTYGHYSKYGAYSNYGPASKKKSGKNKKKSVVTHSPPPTVNPTA